MLGSDVWCSVIKGPHVVVREVAYNVATITIGGEATPQHEPPTTENLSKLENDEIDFIELVCGIPPDLSDHIKLYESVNDVLVTLQALFGGTEKH